MKKKPGFTLRSLCGESFLIAEGVENIDFTNLISLNESSVFLWNSIPEDADFTVDDLVEKLLSEYNVDAATAREDVQELVNNMVSSGIIIE